jgi:hypothetical protein
MGFTLEIQAFVSFQFWRVFVGISIFLMDLPLEGVCTMPKLQNKPPKYCKLNNRAVVYQNGKPVYLGAYGSPESRDAYARIIADNPASPTAPLTTIYPPTGKKLVTVSELAAEFLVYAKENKDYTGYQHYLTIVLDFLEELYGDNLPVDEFKPRRLKHVRTEMIKSGRFCRRVIKPIHLSHRFHFCVGS